MTTSPAQLEQKGGVDIQALIETIRGTMDVYWRFCVRAMFEAGYSDEEIKSEQFFTSKNPVYAELVQTFADAIKDSRGGEMYSVMELLSQLGTLFDSYVRQQEIRAMFIQQSADTPKMTGERFAQLLRQDIDRYWAEKIAKSREQDTVAADIAAEQDNIGRKVERTLRPKFGLRALNFIVIDGDRDRENKLSKALCEGMAVRETDLTVLPNVHIRAQSVDHTLDAINYYTDPDRRRQSPPIDIIFIGSQIKGKKDDEPSDWHSIGLLGALNEIKADARYRGCLKDAKVVVLCKNPDDEFRKELIQFYDDGFILGYMDMSDEHGISLATRLIGLLADKGIVEPDLKNADAQLRLHTDNFNREAKAIIAKHDATDKPGKEFWANEAMLRELQELINRYRAAEGLSEVEFHTEGPYQYTIIVSTLHVERYVKPELLLSEKICACREIMGTIRDIMDSVSENAERFNN